MISKKDVIHVANLAKLELTDEEAVLYQKQMTKILEHFEELSKVPTEGVMPLITPSPIEQHMREDFVIQGFSAEDVLKNSPEVSGNLFKVPPVV